LFSIPSIVFANSTVNPDNADFGSNDSGVLNVSVCRDDAPIFLSLPHLLYAADQYKNRLDGIAPDPNVHRSLFHIEPHTGLVLSVHKRLQINVFIRPEPFIEDFKHISEVIFPAIWINESTTIDQKSADDLNSEVLRYFVMVRWISVAIISLGVVVLIIVIILTKRRSRNGESAPLINEHINRNSIADEDG
jgi:hypothetical protein